MAITKRLTRKFMLENCETCKFCDRKALHRGLSHCKASDVSIKNGACLSRKAR